MPKVITCSRRGGNAIKLEMRVHELEDEFKHKVEFRKRFLEAYALPELVITIIGPVATYFIIRLIEKLFKKEEDTKDVKIQIIHQDFNITFNLPSDNGKCLEHFRRLEKKDDKN